MKPKVSVVMPVHNAERYLPEALNSLLGQTFGDFELIVIDDGSIDASSEVLASIADPRLRVVSNETNRGLIASLNIGMALAKGEYIARMDADDISLPERFEAQVNLLDKHPEIDICGTWFRTIGVHDRIHDHPARHQQILEELLHRGCVIGHPTVMFRKSVLDGLQYETAYEHAEDYRLWARLSLTARFANIPQVLLLYRTHEGQVSERKAALQSQAARRVQAFMASTVDSRIDRTELRTLERSFTGEGGFNEKELLSLMQLLVRLVRSNANARRFNQRNYKKLIGHVWMRACLDYAFDSRAGRRLYRRAPIELLGSWPRVAKASCRDLVNRVWRRATRWFPASEIITPVVVKVSGNLADQMFQYATAFSVAQRHSCQITIDASDFENFGRHRYLLGQWTLSARVMSRAFDTSTDGHKVVHERSFLEVVDLPDPKPDAGVYLLGDWRDFRRFADCMDALRREYGPRAQMTDARRTTVEALTTDESVAVLVSPSEFLLTKSEPRKAWPSACGADFYARAVERMEKLEPNARFTIFITSRRSFVRPVIGKLEESPVRWMDDQSADDLHVLSHAKHFIIPATGYGWWAACLGRRVGKRVFAPSRWRILADRQPPLPPDWELI